MAPLSVHVFIVGSLGTRAPLQEYSNEFPARYCIVRALAGMVPALVCAATGIGQTINITVLKLFAVTIFCDIAVSAGLMGA